VFFFNIFGLCLCVWLIYSNKKVDELSSNDLYDVLFMLKVTLNDFN